jgi:pyrroline-5-carboxylate reductase
MTHVENKLVISTLAGTNCAFFEGYSLLGRSALIRAVPSIACKTGQGIVVLHCGLKSSLSSEQRAVIDMMFSKMGLVFWEEKEALVDVHTAVGASSPAFYSLFVDAIADAAVLMGIPRERAILLAAQSAKGTASLLLEPYHCATRQGTERSHPEDAVEEFTPSGTEASALKNFVCTPGGCTMKGIYVLEQNGVRGHIMNAIEKCCLALKK